MGIISISFSLYSCSSWNVFMLMTFCWMSHSLPFTLLLLSSQFLLCFCVEHVLLDIRLTSFLLRSPLCRASSCSVFMFLWMLHLPPFFNVPLPVEPVPVLSLSRACFVGCYTYLLPFMFLFLSSQFRLCSVSVCIVHVLLNVTLTSFYVPLPVEPVPVLSLHCACFVGCYTYLLSFTFLFLLNQCLFCLCVLHVLLNVTLTSFLLRSSSC